MSENINRINKILDATYGGNLSGLPLFRIVFSDDQREKRFGTYAEHCGKIFLREFCGLREVPKYPYIPHLWVLERWTPPSLAYTPEIPETAQGSYEPVQVFVHENGSAVPVTERIVHHIIYKLFHPELPGHLKSLMIEEDKRNFDREVALNEEELAEAGRTWIGHRLHSKEAIIKP